ncbi:MAG: ABC transporter permease [Fibrobacterales bacterium]
MNLFRSTLRRLFVNLLTFITILTISYQVVKHAPGNPYTQEKAVSEARLKELKEKYDFTYLEYIQGVFKGDLRYSYKHEDRKVSEIISSALPVSLELGFYAMGIAMILGILLGTIAAFRQNQRIDYLLMAFAMVGIAIPNFVLGPLLQLLFTSHFEVFRVAGWNSIFDKVLPTLSLSAMYIAYIARITRGTVLENLKKDYVKTAYAKGLNSKEVALRHVLKNCLVPIVNYLGPSLAAVLTGTLVIEKVYNIPGLGSYFVESAIQRDYPLALGVLITYSILLLLMNLIVDFLQSIIDPRIKFE